MKKCISLILCAVMLLGMVACLAGCGKSIAGRYDLILMKQGDMEIKFKEMMELTGKEVDAYLELNDDGTGLLKMDQDETKMKYADGKIWAEGEDEQKVPYKLDGSELSMEQDGMKMVFEKQ